MMNKINNILKADVTVKSLAIIVTAFMLVTAVPMFVGGSVSAQETNQTAEKHFVFSPPKIVTANDGYVQLQVDGVSDNQNNPGEPTLPLCVYSFELPYGSTGVTAELTHSPTESMVLAEKVIPGPVPYLAGEEFHPLARVLQGILKGIYAVKSPEVAKGVQCDAVNEKIYNSDAGYGESFSYGTYVGVNSEGKVVTYVVCHIMPVTFSSVVSGSLNYITDATVKVSYSQPESSTGSLATAEQYDLLIITAKGYQSILQPLVTHKEAMGLKTKLVTLDEIYSNVYFDVSGRRDNQEMIKYFIYQAYLNWNIMYVLAVGGYRSYSGLNNPNLQFPVQMSYNNMGDGDPWYVCDQYYSCFIKYTGEGAVFDDWDSNGNGRPAEFNLDGIDTYDPYPDVYFGRWACTDRKEAQTMVDKTIYYETNTYGSDWFKTFLGVSGDAFGDFTDLGQAWDVSGVPNGEYTIYAVSSVAGSNFFGPVDHVNITVDHSSTSVVTPTDDSNLNIEPLNPNQKTIYPAKPVTDIIVPSNRDVLGNTNVGPYTPDPESEFYGGPSWADVSYVGGVIKIKAKSYDPSPHGTGSSQTTLHVWVVDSSGTKWLDYNKSSSTTFEGERSVTIAANQLPSSKWNKTMLFTSNGGFEKMSDVLNGFSKGYGIVYFNGHSSVMSWADHYPGIPGGRDDGMVNGLSVLNLRYSGLQRYQAQQGDPLLPMDQLTNGNKQPFVLLLGCHSGMFDTSPMRLLSDPYAALFGTGHIGYYGSYVPEGIAWDMVRQPQGGAIAIVGFTGLGYGASGENTGVTDRIMAGILGAYNSGWDNAGVAYSASLSSFAQYYNPIVLNQLARKTWEESVLLGDPSLKIGGYPPKTGTTTLSTTNSDSGLQLQKNTDGMPSVSSLLRTISTNKDNGASAASLSSTGKVTSNPLNDTSPECLAYENTSGDRFIVGYTAEYIDSYGIETSPAFAYSNGGLVWTEKVFKAGEIGLGSATSVYSWIDKDGSGHTIGSWCFSGTTWSVVIMPDCTDPSTWYIADNPYGFNGAVWLGGDGVAVTGHEGTYGGIWSAGNYIGGNPRYAVVFDWIGKGLLTPVATGSPSFYTHYASDCDHSGPGWHYYVFQSSGGYTYIVCAPTGGTFTKTIVPGRQPDVAAKDGWAYVASLDGNVVVCRRSNNNGTTWSSPVTIAPSGSNPDLIIASNGNVECYFNQNGLIYKAVSTDHGVTWSAAAQFSTADVNNTIASPFQICRTALIYNKGSTNDLYAEILTQTKGLTLSALKVAGKGTIVTTLKNTGVTYLDDLTWTIQIQGDSPLGRFIGGGNAILLELFRGRVLSGGGTSGSIAVSPLESENISSTPAFGFGHVMITATVTDQDDVVLAQTSKDGFLLGGRILLDYLVEG